jgi:16S rRNA (guanine966-N2)-methyltransferase
MRIIAGIYKGHKLFPPKNNFIRPTTDRIREFIFSCLGNMVEKSRVLDLFAGSGSLGIEAFSRGAEAITFVDNSPTAVELIDKNLRKLQIKAKVYHMNAMNFPKFANSTRLTFDIIFADPPYDLNEFEQLMSLVQQNSILQPNGILAYESSSRKSPPCPQGWMIEKQKKLGDTQVTFYRVANE